MRILAVAAFMREQWSLSKWYCSACCCCFCCECEREREKQQRTPRRVHEQIDGPSGFRTPVLECAVDHSGASWTEGELGELRNSSRS
jgi:hypothetical protein